VPLLARPDPVPPPDAAPYAVVARGLGKRFDIYQSDRGRIWEFLGNRKHHLEFWALRDVSFEIPRGSCFGVVGANGAGKSTLIRLMSGVSQPTEGQLQVHARRPGLLDMDLGFHPDFTGRENIALTCAVLGIPEERKAEIAPKVVEFAELEDFMDFPVRTYSSGMQLRLAFSIAAHMNYDVIFIDEVLAVGDQYFQRKCIRKIEEFIGENKTLVLVSHDLHSIRSLCSEVAWIHAGRVVAAGDTQEVVNAYVDVARDREGRIKARIFGGAESAQSRAMASRVRDEAEHVAPEEPQQGDPPSTWFSTSLDPELRKTLQKALRLPTAQQEWEKPETVQDYEQTHGERPIVTGTGEVRVLEVRTLNGEGEETDQFETGKALTVATTFKTIEPLERPILGVAIFRNDDLYVFGPNTRFDGVQEMEGTYDGVYTYFIHYPDLPLLAGVYRLSIALYDKNHVRPHVWHNQLYEIRVTCPREDHGVVEVPHHWGLLRHVSGDAEELP
jgi:lipopolysaccharide transport system ATP-binding protein